MKNLSLQKNIFFQYLTWQFIDVPKEILKIWKNFLLFNLNYFSIPFLIQTFFFPWRKYFWAYPKVWDIGKYFEVFFSNLISRFLGAILRFFLIFLGLLVEIFLFFAGILLFLGWIILPLLLILGLWFGAKIIF